MSELKALELLRELGARARAEGRGELLETEGLDLLEALGFAVPRRIFVAGADDEAIWAVEDFHGARLVVKLVQDGVLHKTELGGVRVIARDRGALIATLDDFAARFPDARGFLVLEFAKHDRSFGHELLVGLRATPDFGPILSLGPGGVAAEFLARELRPGHEVALLAVAEDDEAAIVAALAGKAVVRALTEPQRGQAPLLDRKRLVELVRRLAAFARAAVPELVSEFEINPLVLSEDRLVALDVVVRLGAPPAALPAPRPLARLKSLYEPASIAVIGVSAKMNPGRIILRNVVEAGFPTDRVRVVKPGADEIEGCRCLPDLAALPEPVDLLIVAVAAEQVPEVLREAIARKCAQSLIVIPGGMGERAGGAAIEDEIRALLAEARASEWGGPVVNGGNCLGIRSRPGGYDTLFIPKWKLPPVAGELAPLALISQSGAFAIARQSWLEDLRPRYLVTFGNQIDLTLADHLEYLAADQEVRVFACYVEGFKPDDGRRFCEIARRIRARGGRVILYRAGRSRSGAKAAASHTASVAGDFVVTRELCRQAGVIVAESLEDYDDLVRSATTLAHRPLVGRRLGLMSNAGFECVAMADALGDFELAALGEPTCAKLAAIFGEARLGTIVDVHNPLDVTPIMGDRLFVESARALLEEPSVDIGIIGCVPLSGAIATLPPGATHPEDLRAEGALGPGLVSLARESTKPVLVVIDSGPLYDPLASYLESSGLPVFRRADRALTILARLLP